MKYVCTILNENLLNRKEDPDPDLDPGLAPGPGPRPGSSEIRVSALSSDKGIDVGHQRPLSKFILRT